MVMFVKKKKKKKKSPYLLEMDTETFAGVVIKYLGLASPCSGEVQMGEHGHELLTVVE